MLLTLICAVLGILSGLGVGGGSLLMLWLTGVMDMGQPAARLLNLLFFLPSALIATVLHRKQGRVPLKKLLPCMAAACVSAALCTLWGKTLDTGLLRRLFGVLLLAAGIRELFYRAQ